MTHASILFTLPEDLGDLPGVLYRNYGVSPDCPDAVEEDSIRAYLVGLNPGEVVNFDFEDDKDPLGTITAVTDMLAGMGVRYWAQSDAFEERSRGIRVEGSVVLGMGGKPEWFNLPWTHGAPEFDERTMRAAGVPEEKVAAMIEWAFKSSPSIRP